MEHAVLYLPYSLDANRWIGHFAAHCASHGYCIDDEILRTWQDVDRLLVERRQLVVVTVDRSVLPAGRLPRIEFVTDPVMPPGVVPQQRTARRSEAGIVLRPPFPAG